MVWPTRVRHRERKHAFEEALEEARLTPDDELEGFVDAAMSNPMAQPGVASLGDISVASGYVGSASLARAYEDEEGLADTRRVERPQEAAAKLKAALAAREHTARELARMRRRFAAGHHPDRVPQDLREEAVTAMAEVNAAIDRALKRGATK